MNGLFNPDNRFFRTIDRAADLVWLNVLWVICCIPIVTIGASTTAMYYTTMKMVRNEESYITKCFFHSFKRNLLQATVIWLIAIVFAVILYIDIRVFGDQQGLFYKAAGVALYAMGIVYLLILLYVFPLLAKFDNTTLNTIKNALMLAVLQIPYTVLIAVMIVIPCAVVLMIPYLLIVMILMGGSGIAYATSHIYVKIFDLLIPTEEKTGETSGDVSERQTEE